MDPNVARIAELERELRELKLRLAALERLLTKRVAEHPVDRQAVESKVVYDWQA
jgi:hypothetical protein